jgi:surface antigen
LPQTGPIGSPQDAGSLPTRRELRAQRESLTVAPPAVPVPNAAAQKPVAQKPVASKPAAPAAPAARRSKRRSPLSVAVTLLAIPGIFLTAGLPAYAFTPGQGPAAASTVHSLATAGAQGVTVAASAVNLTVARDGFSATSTDELARRGQAAVSERLAAAARATAAEYAIYGIRAQGDDYPWPYQATNAQGGGLSPLGYYYRECVDFVAWRLNRDAGSTRGNWRWTWDTLTPGGGSASSWADAWTRQGRATSHTPIVGSVAWFNYNHVAYVQSVPGDGTVVLEEYNWMGSHAYHRRTVPVGDVALYLYPPK